MEMEGACITPFPEFPVAPRFTHPTHLRRYMATSDADPSLRIRCIECILELIVMAWFG